VPPKKQTDETAVIADDFTSAEIADHLTQTLKHIKTADALWPGLVKLPAEDKTGNVGKLVTQLGAPLRALFDALTPHRDDDKPKREAKAKLTAVFDNMLGAQDRGKDEARFEVELLVRRLERAEAEQKIVAAYEEARTRFADDALNTGEMVVEPGLRALEVARTAASNSAEFRSLLAPVLDKLGDMTKKARQHQEEARKTAKAKKDAPAKEEEEE
jgi:hypothetical protein